MSEKHTHESLHEFAASHAPLLAEKITKLCGHVIAKGMTGILEEVCRIQSQRDELLDELKTIAEAKPHTWEADVRDQFQAWAQNRARAAVAKVKGGAA